MSKSTERAISLALRVQDTRTRAARGARTILSPSSLTGSALEVAWLAAHAVSYPFGVAQERSRPDVERFSLSELPPVHRGLLIGDVEAAGTPILLLHGLVDNRSIFTVLRRHLRRRGFGRVWTMNYQVWTSDLRAAAGKLATTIEAICAQTGYERIHVIGHSMGGLVARYYIQKMGGDARIHTLVSLGTPHRGTQAARLLPTGVCRQMRPESTLLAELDEPAPGCQTRFLTFWSDVDALMVPKQTAKLEHPDLTNRNILVRGVGHLSLPIDRRVVHEITATLAHLDTGGGTVTAGVTRLEAATTPEADTGRIRGRLRTSRKSASAG